MTYKNCEIVTQLASKDGTPFIKYIITNDGIPSIDYAAMDAALNADERIEKWAYIVHDKDKDEKGLPAAPHIHLDLSFGRTPRQGSTIARMFDVKENCIEKIHTKWPHAVAYLSHHDNPDKYQYDISEIHASFDVNEAIKKSDELKESNNERKLAEEYGLKIFNGEIRLYEIVDKIPPRILLRNDRIISTAKRNRTEYLLVHKQDRDLKCIYMQGPSGAGKTTLAKQMARHLNYSFYISSGSNDPLDGYRGQDCLILDDVRESSMKLSDFFKMLDNHTASSVTSRYYNKILECRLIIITSVINITDFFESIFNHEKEPIKQFKRRCGTLITVGMETITFSQYDDMAENHICPVEVPNTIRDLYPPVVITRDDNIRRMQELGLITPEQGQEPAEVSDNKPVNCIVPEVLKEKLIKTRRSNEFKIRAFLDGDQLCTVAENPPEEYTKFIMELAGNDIKHVTQLSPPKKLDSSCFTIMGPEAGSEESDTPPSNNGPAT